MSKRNAAGPAVAAAITLGPTLAAGAAALLLASFAACTAARVPVGTQAPPVALGPLKVAPPDIPLLIGANSGHAVRVGDMEGGGAEQLGNGFVIGRTTVAPHLGMMGPQGLLVSLVPGETPRVRYLLPEPAWRPLDVRLQKVSDFTFDATGRVMYGISCEPDQVFRYDVQNRELQTLAWRRTGAGQLCPEHITLDAQGRIYVVDHFRVVRMNDISGNGWTAFDHFGNGVGQLNYIRGIAVDSRGRIYLSDLFNRRIVRMDDMGGAGWVEYRTGILDPAGIAVDRYGRIYVAQPSAMEVMRLDDMTGAGKRSFYVVRPPALNGVRGPAVVVPLRPGKAGGVIR